MTKHDTIFYSATLWRLPRVGPKKFKAIIKAFGSPEAFFSTDTAQQKLVGLSFDRQQIERAKQEAKKDMEWLEKDSENHILLTSDSRYPASLKLLSDCPPVLFVKGDSLALTMPQIAIVGSRTASYEGLETAKLFAQYLVNAGITVTSGLAQGIDAAAHQGALMSNVIKEKTVAVMGTGLDRVYPKSNQSLAYQVVEQGAIVSELPIGSPVTRHAFPKRNRIISGLSLGTLVVEASVKSGSLITANAALSQNKEVFAIPGSIHNPLAKGCNNLIRNGAKLVETVGDILEEIKPQLLSFVENEKSARLVNNCSLERKQQSNLSLNNEFHQDDSIEQDEEQSILWKALSYEPQPVEIVSKRSGLAINKISSMLLIMELSGKVIKHPGGRYQKKSI